MSDVVQTSWHNHPQDQVYVLGVGGETYSLGFLTISEDIHNTLLPSRKNSNQAAWHSRIRVRGLL